MITIPCPTSPAAASGMSRPSASSSPAPSSAATLMKVQNATGRKPIFPMAAVHPAIARPIPPTERLLRAMRSKDQADRDAKGGDARVEFHALRPPLLLMQLYRRRRGEAFALDAIGLTSRERWRWGAPQRTPRPEKKVMPASVSWPCRVESLLDGAAG